MLKARKFESAQITSEFCKELWNLRLKNINLRPTVDPEKDFEIFQGYFSDPATQLTTFSDASGVLQGFYGWNLKVIQVRDRPYLRIFIEYGFINIQFRGRYEFVLSLVLEAVHVMIRNVRLPKVAVGVAYPASYISCKLSYPGVITLASSELTVEHEEILKTFLQEHFREGFDPDQGLVCMRTLPIVPSRTSKNPFVQRTFAEYESLNRKWKDGYALPILFEVSYKSFGSLFKRFVMSICS